LIQKIRRKDGIESTLLNISKGLAFDPSNEEIDFLLKNGLVELKRRVSSTASTYGFTAEGLQFKDQFFKERENRF
jgi:hypothetical protein